MITQAALLARSAVMAAVAGDRDGMTLLRRAVAAAGSRDAAAGRTGSPRDWLPRETARTVLMARPS